MVEPWRQRKAHLADDLRPQLKRRGGIFPRRVRQLGPEMRTCEQSWRVEAARTREEVALSLVCRGGISSSLSVHRDVDRLGRNAVCHHLELAGARFHAGGDVEVRRNRRAAGLHAHGAVIMGAGIEHMAGLHCW